MSQRAQRIIEAARKVPLPEGTYSVGLGLMISGLTAYGFQILAFKALDKPDYAALNGLWIFVFVVAPGFLPPARAGSGPGGRRPARHGASAADPSSRRPRSRARSSPGP